MWFRPGRRGAVDAARPIPAALTVAIGICAPSIVVVVGVYPQLFARIGELAFASSRSTGGA